MGIDPRLMIGAIDARDAVERIVLRDRCADKAALEDIRAADRRAIRLHRRIRLPAVEWLGGIKKIRIDRGAVVGGLATISVGVEREITAAGIEQDAAIDTPVDGIDGRSGFDVHARRRLHVRGWPLCRYPV